MRYLRKKKKTYLALYIYCNCVTNTNNIHITQVDIKSSYIFQ